MAVDFDKPQNSEDGLLSLDQLRENIEATLIALEGLSPLNNLKDKAKRWNPAGYWQRYNLSQTTWEHLFFAEIRFPDAGMRVQDKDALGFGITIDVGNDPVLDFEDLFHFKGTSTGKFPMTLSSSGKVGINKQAPTYELDVLGDINFTGNFYLNGVLYDVALGGGASVLYVDTQDTALQLNIDGKEDSFAKQTGFNLVLGSGSGQVAEGDHTHDYEPSFAKQTGFNLVLGSGSGQVAEGDHTHDYSGDFLGITATATDSGKVGGKTLADIQQNITLFEDADNTDVAPGWYTIAVLGTYLPYGAARFGVSGNDGAFQHYVIFYAATQWGDDASHAINVIHQSVYGDTPDISKIRIKSTDTSTDGAVLQIYVSNADNNLRAVYLGDAVQADWGSGWGMKDWIPDNTDPGGVNNYESMISEKEVDLNKAKSGGIITSGDSSFQGGLQLGNSVQNVEGNFRWTGTDAEVYKSGAWVSLTEGGGGGGGGGPYYPSTFTDLNLEDSGWKAPTATAANADWILVGGGYDYSGAGVVSFLALYNKADDTWTNIPTSLPDVAWILLEGDIAWIGGVYANHTGIEKVDLNTITITAIPIGSPTEYRYGGITSDANFVYCVANRSGSNYYCRVYKIDKSDLSIADSHSLDGQDGDWRYPLGIIQVGGYLYLCTHLNGALSRVAYLHKIDVNTLNVVATLDLEAHNSTLEASVHPIYSSTNNAIYLSPAGAKGASQQMAKVDLSDFTTNGITLIDIGGVDATAGAHELGKSVIANGYIWIGQIYGVGGPSRWGRVNLTTDVFESFTVSGEIPNGGNGLLHAHSADEKNVYMAHNTEDFTNRTDTLVSLDITGSYT
jgi:hypothetical protein